MQRIRRSGGDVPAEAFEVVTWVEGTTAAVDSMGDGPADMVWPSSDDEGFPPPLPLRDPLVWGVFFWSFFLLYMCGMAGG